MKDSRTKGYLVIGARDKVALPELGLEDLACKIDTGAATSSLHCHKATVIEQEGQELVRFFVLDPAHPHYAKKAQVLPLYDRRMVKSSNGQSEERLFIKTKIQLFGEAWPIELSLADRSKMSYPMLLGERFLRKRFLVDVSQKDLSANGQRTSLTLPKA